MSAETRQALKTIGLSALVVAALVALAWWSMLGMVLVTLGTLLGLVVGWRLGYRYATAQAAQARRARRRRPSAPASSKSTSAKEPVRAKVPSPSHGLVRRDAARPRSQSL